MSKWFILAVDSSDNLFSKNLNGAASSYARSFCNVIYADGIQYN